ncbi:UNVERIFIED_CONTAM: hypothetical protein K2H54_066698 [Gekko kuhli]
MIAYSLNLCVFWPLVTCGCTALLGLWQALRTQAGAAQAGAPVELLKGTLLVVLLAYLALHGKAHASLVVGELVHAGKMAGRLARHRDFKQVGSAYKQHKVHLQCAGAAVPASQLGIPGGAMAVGG